MIYITKAKKEAKLKKYTNYLHNAEAKLKTLMDHAGIIGDKITAHGGTPIIVGGTKESYQRNIVKKCDRAFSDIFKQEEVIKYWKDKIEALSKRIVEDDTSIERFEQDINDLKNEKEALKEKNKLHKKATGEKLEDYNSDLYLLNHQIKLKESRLLTAKYKARKSN